MLRRILKGGQEELLAESRRLLADLRDTLSRCDAADDDLATLEQSVRQLDELFLLVVAGEFNAGKSAFINALLGDRILEEGVTPTTTRVQVLRYGPEPSRSPLEPAVDAVTAPVDLLREIHLVDTPGTNAILREHEAITREFVPRADLVLFVTSADRPFTESERAFLAGIRDWGKKVVVVLNKIDILETGEEIERVRAFIAEGARDLLGFVPEIYPVAARGALRAKQAGDAAGLAASRFPELEEAIVRALDERERVRLKLLNPLGVGEHLTQRAVAAVDGRLEILREDFAALDASERQLALYREDMRREFRFRLADADNLLQELENRGMAFFDDTVRFSRILELLDRKRIKADFERRVVADVPQQIDRKVTEIIDWMIGSELRQWQGLVELLAKRQHLHANRMVGGGGLRQGFDVERERLLGSVGRAASRAVDSFDREREAARLADSVKTAVQGTALAEVGAIGLGALLTHLAATAAADATGLIAAGTVAVLGFFILPNRRHAAKRDLRTKIAALREELMGTLTAQFDREIEGSLLRLAEATAPYTRFVKSEREHLQGAHAALAACALRIAQLKGKVEAI
jgi:small GTP-binding protein